MTEWLVDGWIPLGKKIQDAAPEGSFKTVWGAWQAVCIAAGHPIFGRPVHQGPVLIVDEETPLDSLEKHLTRFAWGIGQDYSKLEIYVKSFTEFEFGDKGKLEHLLDLVSCLKPAFIRLDSLISMLPRKAAREGLVTENTAGLGRTLRYELDKLIAAAGGKCSTSLVVHTKKDSVKYTVDELNDSSLSMQTVVRGHGGIVGQGSDCANIMKKISEHPAASAFAIIGKVRRYAIHAPRVIYARMVEEEYGEGWARLEQCSRIVCPTRFSRDLYPLFLDTQVHSRAEICKTFPDIPRREVRESIEEMVLARAILNGVKPGNYKLNGNAGEMDELYLQSIGFSGSR